MIQLNFEGWFECRLATDPDPTDEPRGVSGWTYALAREPDFDKIIRTQPVGVVNRRFAPDLGVNVYEVIVDDCKDKNKNKNHPLVNASVELLGDPIFEGRNGLAYEDTEEPIYPFHLKVEKSGIVLEREFRELSTGEWTLEKSVGVVVDPSALARAGITDPDNYVANRKIELQQALETETDEVEKVRLETRIHHIDKHGVGLVPLPVGLKYRYILEGPWVKIKDSKNKLAETIDNTPWIFDLWVGCWDRDLLCGFMYGSLTCASTC